MNFLTWCTVLMVMSIQFSPAHASENVDQFGDNKEYPAQASVDTIMGKAPIWLVAQMPAPDKPSFRRSLMPAPDKPVPGKATEAVKIPVPDKPLPPVAGNAVKMPAPDIPDVQPPMPMRAPPPDNPVTQSTARQVTIMGIGLTAEERMKIEKAINDLGLSVFFIGAE